MFIKISALLLSSLLFLSQSVPSCGVLLKTGVESDANPFSAQDKERHDSLAQAVSLSINPAELKTITEDPFDPDRSFLVQFLKTCQLTDMASSLDGERFRFCGYSENRLVLLQTDCIDDFLAKAGTIIAFCEKDQVISILPESLPNDEYYEQQYSHDMLNIPEAWSYTSGSNHVVVAVIDSGIMRNHPDFIGASILPGRTYLPGKLGPCKEDLLGHGTLVSGVIAAVTDNGIGVAGICKKVSILPMQIFDGDAYTTDSAVLSALYDAADAGADVISMSFISDEFSGLHDAVQYAYNKNCILVAGSGNSSSETKYYPSSFPEVVCVGSVGETGEWTDFSTYSDAMDVVAPGENIATTYNNGGFVSADGTSLSCPHVSAVAALARTLSPDISPSQFLELATSTANDVAPSGYDKKTGYGIIDAERILSSLSGTRNFVTRFYQLCLGREPDKAGLDNWCSQLSTKKISGADVAYGFVFSEEFIGSNKTNEEYVDILYKAFFNREPDAGGKKNWLDALSSGLSRKYVLAGFVGSTEFSNLCSSYGIDAGSLTLTEPRDLYPETAKFVSRFYRECLGRTPDTAGLNQWVADLQSGKSTGAQVAYGFIFSQEFTNKNISDENYVTILYKAFFNRSPDKAGYDGWLKQLKDGTDRKTVLAGFVNSQEFAGLAARYGILPGTL